MPVSGNRSINQEHVNIWYDNIEKYSPDNVKDVYLSFAKTYIEILMYVDFNTFLTSIEEIAQDITILLKNHKQYDKIYFYIPEEVTKSNFWITLLVFHYFDQLSFRSRSRSRSRSIMRQHYYQNQIEIEMLERQVEILKGQNYRRERGFLGLKRRNRKF